MALALSTGTASFRVARRRSRGWPGAHDAIVGYGSLLRYLTAYAAKGGGVPSRAAALFAEAVERVAARATLGFWAVRAAMVSLVGDLDLPLALHSFRGRH